MAALAALQEVYEDFVAVVTENRTSPLMEISEHLLVFSLWNLAATTAVSALKQGISSCGGSMPYGSVCSLFPDSLLLVAPLLVAEGGQVTAGSDNPVQFLSDLARRAMDLIALVRQGLIVQGNSVVGAAVAYAMDLVYVALVKPEFGMSWLTAGGAPRLLLPHCSAVDFAEALPWEGVTRPHDPMHWLHPLLERLEEKAFLNVEVSDRDAAPDCELNGFGSFQDPVCGLAKLGRHDTLVLQRSLTSCVGQSTCLGGAQLIPGARSLQGPLRLEIDEAEAIIADRGVDVLALSPKAGNCAELKRLLEWMGATPQVLVLNINPVLAVPLRVAPDFLRARKLGEHLDSCSLQTATDFLAPQFLPLFVDTARAVFVAQAALSRFGKVGHLPSLWRRGVSCTLPISEWLGEKVVQEAAALGGADWPCQKLLDSNVPRLPLAAMRGVQNKELYKEVRCGGHAGQLNLEPATLPMTPGRGQMLRGRGRCFLEDGFCECFPPWRDALCDKEDLGDRQDEPQGVLIATRLSHAPGGMEMLRQNLHNWWESFNHQLDRPILIFHQGLSRSEASQLRQASPNRVWFSHLGPLLRRPRKIYKEKHDEALHCRFKFAWVIEEPSIESYDWLMWLDADMVFPVPFERDLVRETSSASASLGFLSERAKAAPVLKNLFLLFREAERARGEAVEGSPETGLSSRLMVLQLAAFRSGPLQRFAQWALEFSGHVPLCRWGDSALRALQAGLLPTEERLALQL
ncbi:unnamed protein product [Effrenium voratum]|nr:unnamed protein product [Effrenium voratum]